MSVQHKNLLAEEDAQWSPLKVLGNSLASHSKILFAAKIIHQYSLGFPSYLHLIKSPDKAFVLY